MNPTQKMPDFRSGQPLRADALNHIVAAVLRMIVGGKGINVKSAAGKVVVEAEGQPIPRTGGGAQVENDTSFVRIVYAPSFSGLAPPPGPNYIARVDGSGSDDGMTCVPSGDLSSWEPVTHFW